MSKDAQKYVTFGVCNGGWDGIYYPAKNIVVVLGMGTKVEVTNFSQVVSMTSEERSLWYGGPKDYIEETDDSPEDEVPF